MRTSSAKQKGKRACAEVKELLHKHQPALHDDDVIITPSGCPGVDLRLSPKAQETYPIVVEVKNQERVNIWAALEQCESHKNKNNHTPVLFFKKNRTKLYACLDADTLVKLLANQKSTVSKCKECGEEQQPNICLFCTKKTALAAYSNHVFDINPETLANNMNVIEGTEKPEPLFPNKDLTQSKK